METMIKTYGQTPKQLFNAPHPTRMELDAVPITATAASSALITHLTNKAIGGKASIMMGIEPSRVSRAALLSLIGRLLFIFHNGKL